MLYEYAILPDVFRASLLDNPSTCRELKRLLRCLRDENGLLADLHNGDWHSFVREKILSRLPSTTCSDIKVLLSQLQDRHRLIPHPKYSDDRPNSRHEWLYAALESDKRTTLSGIVLSQDLIDQCEHHTLFMEISEAFDSPLWTERKRTVEVETSVLGYEKAFFPVLKYARTVDLIDPFINCNYPRFTHFVELCVRLLGCQRPTQTTRLISIHAGEPYERDCPESQRQYCIEQRQTEWKDYLSGLVKSNPKLFFRVFFWSARKTNVLFHERYLLTDQCGIHLGLGTDVRAGNTTTCAFLDEDVRQKQIERFQRNNSPFENLAQFEVR